MAAAQRQLQGLQRRIGVNLFQRFQCGLAHADMVVVQRLGQRWPAAAALAVPQPLSGLKALAGAGILTQYKFQPFPRFVLGQLRQRLQGRR